MTHQSIIIEDQKKKICRNPERTDSKIILLLEENGAPMKFHEICKQLAFTSGKLQTAIKRLIKKQKIVKKKVVEQGNYVTKIYFKEFDADIIIPVKINETTAKIIEMVPNVTDRFSSLNELIKISLITFFKNNISVKIKKAAIQKAIENGLLTKKQGEALLNG